MAKIDRRLCNICNNTEFDFFNKKNCYDLLRCTKCGLVFVKDIPEKRTINNIYDRNFFEDYQKTFDNISFLEDSASYKNAIMRISQIYKKGYKCGNLLDIGCSVGIFPYVASRYFSATGIDISEYAINRAKIHFNCRFLVGDVLEKCKENNFYDVVTMWDVIEHLKSPREYIAHIKQLLKFGGLLAITTGNINSLMFKLQRSNWHLLIPPIHLFYFNTKNLIQLLTENDFRILENKLYGQFTDTRYIMRKISQIHNSPILNKINVFLDKYQMFKNVLYLNLFDVMTVFAVNN
jgi:2-polyprenyl-3-methyl-5-hydroxy-6-metoxy-1,4-benzoquinol methylase